MVKKYVREVSFLGFYNICQLKQKLRVETIFLTFYVMNGYVENKRNIQNVIKINSRETIADDFIITDKTKTEAKMNSHRPTKYTLTTSEHGSKTRYSWWLHSVGALGKRLNYYNNRARTPACLNKAIINISMVRRAVHASQMAKGYKLYIMLLRWDFMRWFYAWIVFGMNSVKVVNLLVNLKAINIEDK